MPKSIKTRISIIIYIIRLVFLLKFKFIAKDYSDYDYNFNLILILN